MLTKKAQRLRRSRQTRTRIAVQGVPRLVLAVASSLDKDLRESMSRGSDVRAATVIGRRIAEKAKAAGIDKVAFDRSGFAYHGRVKALAEAARESGLQF